MNLYEKILRNVYFTVIIWEQTTDGILCVFTNKNNIVKQGTKLDMYLEKNINLSQVYNKLLYSKKEQDISIDNEHIVLFYMPDNIFYEIRTNIKNTYNFHLLAYISNQTRNPLTSILGSIFLLKDMELTTA